MHLAAFIEIASPQTPPSLFIALDALGETLAVPHRYFKFTNLLQIVNLLKMMYIWCLSKSCLYISSTHKCIKV